ncbi:MAG TPA: hypothetical protein VLT85_06940, partial [Terriglobales bacterium]|nr:hypothetical protein [Terriglobales bacterium]
QLTTDYMVKAAGLKVVTPAAEFTVQQRTFMRLDLEQAAGSQHAYEGYIQTVANGHLLTIEIYASSQEELQQIAGSLQSISITEPGH